MAEATINMRRLMAQMTLRVRVVCVREHRARMWVAVRLIRLAARVLGCGVEVRTESEDA